MTLRDQITQQSLSLAPEDRAYIADMLEQCLTSQLFADPALSQAWATELDRRIQAYDRGELTADDAESVLKRLLAKLEQHNMNRVSS